MSKTVTLAAGQFCALPGRADANLEAVARLAKRAADRGADFILFPEDCLTGYPVRNPGAAAEVALVEGGPEHERLSEIACDLEIGIAAGALISERGAYYCTHWIEFPDGRGLINMKCSVDDCEKRMNVTPDKAVNEDFDILGVPTALAICSDGTPKFYRRVADAGIKIALHPSCGSCNHWVHRGDEDEAEVAASEARSAKRCIEGSAKRAIECGAAVICANPVGFDGDRGYPGNSWVVGPDGVVHEHLVGVAVIEDMHEGVALGTITFD